MPYATHSGTLKNRLAVRRNGMACSGPTWPDVDAERTETPDAPGAEHAEAPGEAVLRATRLLLGTAIRAVDLVRLVAGRPMPGPPSGAAPPPGRDAAPEPAARLLPSALLGVGAAAQRRALSAVTATASAIGGRAAPRMAGLVGVVIPQGVTKAARLRIEAWSARGRHERLCAEAEAIAATHVLIDVVTEAVIDRLDLDAVVSRVDPDKVAARVDLDALLDRIDLAAVTERVLEEIDIGRLVRESGGGMAAETMDSFRVQSMRADRFVNRVVDRLLLRGDAGTSTTDTTDTTGKTGGTGSDSAPEAAP
jgi:hypothetical protein